MNLVAEIYKINIQNSIAFLYTGQQFKQWPLNYKGCLYLNLTICIPSRRVKYLGVNLPKEV